MRFVLSFLVVFSITSTLMGSDKPSESEFASILAFRGFYQFVSAKGNDGAEIGELCPPLIGVVSYKGKAEGYYYPLR